MSKEIALEHTDILEFMALRSPRDIDAPLRQRHYIHDRTLVSKGEEIDVVPTPLLTSTGPSEIAGIVYTGVLVENRDINEMDLLGLLSSVAAALPTTGGWSGGNLTFADIGDRAMFDFRALWFVVPDRLEDISGSSGVDVLVEVRKSLRALGSSLSVATAKAAVLAALHQPSLREGVLAPVGDFTFSLFDLWRRLFDQLYLLYSLRKSLGRRAIVRFDDVIGAMRALHLMEALAVDDALTALGSRTEASLSMRERDIYHLVRRLRPALNDWTLGQPTRPQLAVRDTEDVRTLLRAKPALHPIFSRGRRYLQPFNSVSPIGVGDLKVVRQRLLAYRPGEISYIHNVLMGENRERKSRRLEKSEDTFVTSLESSRESQSEHQGTDRFELRRDAQESLKQTLGVNVNGSVTYDNKVVIASASTGFSFQSAAEDASKTAEALVKEAVTKSVNRVATRTSEQRTSVRLNETEDTNLQVFDGKDATQHISGIYRWVDKQYEAQVWNVGRRMMFEFIVPEPAHFLVESRLRAYAQDTPLPAPPVLTLKTVEMPLGIVDPSSITQDLYARLELTYDLSGAPYPNRAPVRRGFFADAATGQETVSGAFAAGIDQPESGERRFRTHAFASTVGLEGYELSSMRLIAFVKFHELNETLPGGSNQIELFVDGLQVLTRSPGEGMWQVLDQVVDVSTLRVPLHEQVEIMIGLQDAMVYSFSIGYTATRVDDGVADWRRRVHQIVHAVERSRVEEANRRLQAQYDADFARYQSRLAEFRARTANDILQGRSGLLNARVITDELKKHCLSLLAKEFDSNPNDDRLSYPAVATRTSDNIFNVFQEPSSGPAARQRLTLGTFTERALPFPAMDIHAANAKAPLVQFLEQAFEWTNMAYVFYAYFWGAMPRWIELMNRFDAGDPLYTSFLQAGSCKVLLAASPGYEEAVLHFLATGQPWEGGPSPVIDDPLFLPIHEEIRRQQLAGADGTPEGTPWTFMLPTSLVYLQDSSSPLPEFDEPQ